MCGRFTLILEPEALQEDLKLGEFPAGLTPRYNIAPTQPVAAVGDPVARTVKLLHWGLIPSWAKDASIGSKLINARAETLVEKPSFRTAFTKRRCLILADGFYEWRRGGGKSEPFYFRLAEGQPFAFAGLWDLWRTPQGEAVQSCTIITVAANGLVARCHERMPALLSGNTLWAWLDPQAGPADLQALLQPYPADAMTAWPVSGRLNSPAYEAADCITPLTGAAPL